MSNRPFRPQDAAEPLDHRDATGEDFRATARELAFDLFFAIQRRADAAMSMLEIGDDRGSRYLLAEIRNDADKVGKLLANIQASLRGLAAA